MDPYNSTRHDFTDNLVNKTYPADADKGYLILARTMTNLLKALAYHDAMSPNIDQAFMTPANYKNKIYFMWDFVGRTIGLMATLDPKNPQAKTELWNDVTGRSMMACVMIRDTTSGKLDLMCPDERGLNAEFGDEIVRLAEKVTWEAED